MRARKFIRDESGTSMVEFSIVMTLFFVVFFGIIEFSLALWQWNSVSKAAQLGARLAVVSNPVFPELAELAALDVSGGEAVFDPVPDYISVCDYSTNTTNCTCTGSSKCPNSPGFDVAALDVMIYGRDLDTTCGNRGADRFPSMCDIFPDIGRDNVVVEYRNSGMGFLGHPTGAVPTVTVRLKGLDFQFVFLQGLLGFTTITMPDMTVTMSGEDLNFSAP